MSIFSFLRRKSALYAVMSSLLAFGATANAAMPAPDGAENSTKVAPAKSDLGPPIGRAVPHDLSLNDSPDFAALRGENGMALIFVRSVDWCPFCKRQVIDISKNEARFAALGLSLVYVTNDSPEKQAKFAKRRDIQGTFIADEESKIIDAFGLRNENHKEGEFGYGIPHPAVFIIDTDQIVKAKLFEEDYATNKKSYANRPEVETILDAAKTAMMSEQ